MNFNIIGAGRLGKNIALALSSHKLSALQAIYNLHYQSGQQACHDLGMGLAIAKIEDLPPADITWITCNDDAISSIVNSLTRQSVLKPGSLIIHCSGVLASNILEPLKKQGCHIASLHPLKAFKKGYLDAEAFMNVDCVIEGDEPGCQWLKSSLMALKANVVSINPGTKDIYHAAACIASNYLVTLASCSEQLLLETGIGQDEARLLINKLMQGSLNNIKGAKMTAQALTGPLMRGDEETLRLHHLAIEDTTIKSLYKTLGIATLPLTQLSEDKKRAIHALLDSSF